jgi:hypothetical protein
MSENRLIRSPTRDARRVLGRQISTNFFSDRRGNAGKLALLADRRSWRGEALPAELGDLISRAAAPRHRPA